MSKKQVVEDRAYFILLFHATWESGQKLEAGTERLENLRI